MSQPPPRSTPQKDKNTITAGAFKAFIGRLGALIELVSIIAFAWAYGETRFGLFAALWSYVKVTSGISAFAMTTALQRFVPFHEQTDWSKQTDWPKQTDQSVSVRSKAASVAGLALLVSGGLSFTAASLIWLFAPLLATYINAGENDSAHLADLIRLYVWVIPLWTMVEVGTAAIRARRTFGPEIKIRIFYEQSLRLAAALLLAFSGFLTYGLYVAHLFSVGVAALLALRLVGKSYGAKALTDFCLSRAETSEILYYCLAVFPSNAVKKLFSELPVMLLNLLLPGAAGAAAGGYYSIARKLASSLQVVRLTFDYVMAPLAAEKASRQAHADLKEMVVFATRLAVTFALPLAAALMSITPTLLRTLPAGFGDAYTAIAVLLAARSFETATGPSSVVIEATAHRFLPLLNNGAGLCVMLGLSFFLIPANGPFGGLTGAALAAGSGISLAALLNLTEMSLLKGLFPYQRHGNKAIGLGVISAVIFGLLIWLFPTTGNLSHIVIPAAALLWLLVTFFLQIRFGLSASDAAALGRIGMLIRRNR